MRKGVFYKRALAGILAGIIAVGAFPVQAFSAKKKEEVIKLRVCNWEEYIDFGDWDEGDKIDLESAEIFGVNAMWKDYEDWYYETYGKRVKVEYSSFGTNEDLYNMLTLGDEYDLVCPSEYMFMKLMDEGKLVPLSDAFYDTSDENNFYARGVSPYLKNIFDKSEINGESWSKYAAGYMWGVTGIVYNPEFVTEEEASTWKILGDPKFKRRITIKDNVRDSYFAAVGALKHDLLTDPKFISDPNYLKNLENEMNDVSPDTIQAVQDYLQDVKNNAYSFETESGKADMITGKVVANLQWSGDGVYTLDQADDVNFLLNYTVPVEATNVYFDGWVMLKSGIDGDAERQHAAEAFINFISRPDNVIRNMNYVGYTSVIAGGDDPLIYEYAEWSFGAEDDEEDTIEYPLGWFFSGDEEDENYILTASSDCMNRQLRAQYPTKEDMARSSIMVCFDNETNEKINQMWINVRCFNLLDVPVWVWILIVLAIIAGIVLYIRAKKKKVY